MDWSVVGTLPHYRDRSDLLAAPIELAAGVQLMSLPDWVAQDARLAENLSVSARDDLKRTRYCLLVGYEADSFGEPDPEWTGKQPSSKQDRAAERLDLAAFALWLATPCDIGIGLMLDYESGSTWVRRRVTERIPFDVHKADLDACLSREAVERAKNLHAGLLRLQRGAPVWAAVRLLWKALTDHWWESRFAMLWIAMEALFGPENPGETTFRLSLRAGFFLASEPSDVRRIFRAVKKSYGLRSQTVHGLRIRKKLTEGASLDRMQEVEAWLCDGLTKILLSPDHMRTFESSKLREAYLEDLVFVPSGGEA